MEIDLVNRQPLGEHLSGLELEYCVVQLYSRDAGKREATLLFDLGGGTFDLGLGNDVKLQFDCAAAVDVKLEILDHDGRPTVAQLTFRDASGHVYPGLSRRLAPDFYFHEQIYRRSGESVRLPAGKYRVTYGRGPEYRLLEREITVPSGKEHHETFRLVRWINMAEQGWFSGDHHIHAAGCAHYDSPTEGVGPQDMMRQILGEDLNVGCVLSWGPCWYFQKQFFEGKVHKLSTNRHLMRYDVETSGFPSSHAGHLCLLRLREDEFPGTTEISQWPSWDLPILKWGKGQGGVVGFAHSGFGLQTASQELPNFEMPPFDAIGANEYIMDVTHGACDFISTVDTPILWELNIWYHTLNCGYTTRISGETDYPCLSEKHVGSGRTYVRMEKNRPLDYDQWIEGIRDGRSYCTEGLSHLFDFSVSGLGVGEKGPDGRPSVLPAHSGQNLQIRVRAAALLAEKPNEAIVAHFQRRQLPPIAALLAAKPNEAIRRAPLDQQPYWHIERARIGDTRQVPVELIVNGRAVRTQQIRADGSIHELTFQYQPTQSSWLALRIFPSSHTNPVFVEVDGKPIRASRKSAQWCRKAVDVCWEHKQPRTRPAEKAAAAAAYEHARKAYQRIEEESQAD